MKISIITITYNAEHVLEKTMLSVLNQTNTNFEYIIIDGNSKDNTVSIIQKMAQKIQEGAFEGIRSDQFKWISEPDKGLYDAMNKGIDVSTGDFVWFVNAGDKVYNSETLQKIYDLIEIEKDCDFIYGQSVMIDEQDREIGERHKIAPKVLRLNSFLNGLVICHQSVIVKKSIASHYNMNYSIASDYDWVIRAYQNSECQGYIDQYLSKFMVAGVSSQKRQLAWKERYMIMKEHFGIIKTIAAHVFIVLKYPFSRKY
ncbi:MAG: glycosyl transferase [Bacteroidetes bacterium]|nr:glycosyl transferase [Bacteroidota bacterium]